MSDDTNAFGQPVGRPVPGWASRPRPDRTPMTGRWCTLEALDPARHSEDLYRANSVDDGRMWTYLPQGPFSDLAGYRRWMDSFVGDRDVQALAIVDHARARAVGVAAYLRMSPAEGTIEVGHLAYSPALQATTAATETMALMMARVFDELGYRRYEWKCNALNAPSRRAALRLGFSYEGTFRQALVVKGRNRDTAWYSVTDVEWPRLREQFARWLDPANFDAGGRQRRSLSSLTAR